MSGAVPPPAARPLERAARVPVCVCVRVRALLGRVGRAGLPGAFWCASPFPLAALSFCFAWPPPGWGCPPLSRCCCLSSLPWRLVFFFFFFFSLFFFFPPAAWLVGVSRLAVGCSLVVAPPPPFPFVSRGFCCSPLVPGCCFLFFFCFFFFFFFFFFPSRSPFSVRPRCFWLSLVSNPGCLGPRRLVVCFVGLPFLGSPCACSSFVLSAGCRLLPRGCCPAPPPPPLLFLAVSVAAARCPLALPVALGPSALRRCVLRCSPALCALCCVCFVVARECVLLFAALLCAVCVPGRCAVRSLCSPLRAVLCFAVLVRSRCAVRVVRAVAGACGALLCVVLFPVVCRGAVLGLLARGCLLVACFGAGVPVWPRGLLPCGWCGLLWCPAFLCRVLWCCAVAWCCAAALCCHFAVLLGLALPFCGLSRCAVLCCWLAVLFFARWWCLRAVVLFPSCPGAVLPRGAVVSCPVALLGLFLAWVWLYLLEKPRLYFVYKKKKNKKKKKKIENKIKLYTTQHTRVQQDHVRCCALRATRCS